MLDAWNLRLLRPAAGGQEDVSGAEHLAVDLNPVPIQQARVAFQQGDPAVDQQGAVNAVQALDFTVLVGDQGGPVEARLCQLPAKVSRLGKGAAEVGAVHQQFFRHAADIHAGAAQVTAFRHRHLGAKAGGETGRAHSAGTGTDDEKIKVVTHQYSPACSWLRR